METVLITAKEFLTKRLDNSKEYRFGQLVFDYSDKCIAKVIRGTDGIWYATVFFTKTKGQKVGFLKTKPQVIAFINKHSRNSI